MNEYVVDRNWGLTFNILQRVNAVRQSEWDRDGKIDLSFRAMELGGEAGELLNVCKKIVRERMGLRGSRAMKEQLAEELADVVLCASLIAIGEGIDLGSAIVRKFNKTSEERGLATKFI